MTVFEIALAATIGVFGGAFFAVCLANEVRLWRRSRAYTYRRRADFVTRDGRILFPPESGTLREFRVALALRTLDVAITGCKPARVFALFSGGGDSTVAAHIAAQHPLFDGAVFIDTGTSLSGVQEHAEAVAAAQGWPLAVIRSPESYEDMIRRDGLPGPGQHPTAYVRLKEKALDAHIKALCTRCASGERHRKHDTVLWVSGARGGESVRRMGNAEWLTIDGSQPWVNPILDWTKAECRDYRDAHGLPTSDVAALIHRSGECNCGTYASEGEREMLRALDPEFAARMDEWERLAIEHGHDHACRWGERPTEKRPGQIELVPRHQTACSDCANRVLVPPSEVAA